MRAATWVLVGFAVAAGAAARADIIPPGQGLGGSVTAAGVKEEMEQASQLFRQAKYEACLDKLQEAVKAHPELPPARFLMGMLFLATNQAAQGRRLLEQGAAEAPAHPDIAIAFGKIALAEGRLHDARLNFERAATLADASTWNAEQQKKFRALVHEGLATVAEGRGDWGAAREELAAWLELDPKDGRARQRLGRALFAEDQPDDAFKQLKQAAQDEPTLDPPGVTMGRLYAQRRDARKAAEWMDYAVKAAPKDPRVHLARAAWLLDQGRPEDARAALDAAAKLDPKSLDVKRLRGLAARLQGDAAEAERQFQAVVQESPGDLNASNQLALALLDQDDEAKRRRGLELAEVNARQAPNAPEVLATLGVAYARLERFEESERAFQAAAARGQISSDTAYDFARVLARRGRDADARTLLKSALDTPGTFIHRKAAEAQLKQLAAPAEPAKTP